MTHLILAALLHCGTERWGAKTLSDGARLSFKPKAATVDALIQIPYQNHGRSDPRSPGVESTLYQVKGYLLGYKQESDEDFHIVLGDAPSNARTMIVEVPNSNNCVANHDPSIRSKMSAVRSVVERLGGQPAGSSMYWSSRPTHVLVTGFGFFDFAHHQTGLAPNAIEIHPVLRIEAIP